MDSVPVDSVPVIPWPFRNLPEFRGTEMTILACSSAKIPFRRIPGITRIPADSGRNTWGTVKNSENQGLQIPEGRSSPSQKYGNRESAEQENEGEILRTHQEKHFCPRAPEDNAKCSQYPGAPTNTQELLGACRCSWETLGYSSACGCSYVFLCNTQEVLGAPKHTSIS